MLEDSSVHCSCFYPQPQGTTSILFGYNSAYTVSVKSLVRQAGSALSDVPPLSSTACFMHHSSTHDEQENLGPDLLSICTSAKQCVQKWSIEVVQLRLASLINDKWTHLHIRFAPVIKIVPNGESGATMPIK